MIKYFNLKNKIGEIGFSDHVLRLFNIEFTFSRKNVGKTRMFSLVIRRV